MPIYEYICKSCDFEFEKIRSFSDSSMPACPSCENEDVARKMAVPAIHFKGSGWYINDSKSSNKNKSDSKSTSGDSNKSSDDVSGKGDSSSGESDTKGSGDATPSTDKPKGSSSSEKKSESSSKKSTK